MVSNIYLLVVEKHTIDGCDGSLSSFGRLIMNEAVAFRTTMFIGCDFARQDVAKSCECVMESLHKNGLGHICCSSRFMPHLVIDLFIEVLDEDVTLASFTEGRVTLRPHDPAT
jgi:hypothetical protein